MTFELLCMAVIGLLIGLALLFGGYRWFLILLPIWGFFFGFGLGAQTLQALFGLGALATVTSWVVGFLTGMVFAVLSYLFYFVAVALVSAGLGYGIVVGIMLAIGFNMGAVVWLLGVVGAVIAVIVVFRFNLQKYAIIALSSLAGAGAIILSLFAPFNSAQVLQIIDNPVSYVIGSSFWWALFFVILAIFGIIVQVGTNRSFEIDNYNRLSGEAA